MTTKTATAPMTVKEKPLLKLRHEFKHRINAADDLILTARLRKLFQHDKHADSHGSYRVSSLYFDTPYDKALRQKIDSVDRREKFRLRYYGEETQMVLLEKKFKLNGLCGKHKVRLSEDEARRLLTGDIAFLLHRPEALCAEFYSKLQGERLAPKTIVVYDREAFLYMPGNVRITLDRRLRSGLRSLDFLEPEQFRAPVSDGLTVLEVKYDAFLPEIVRMAVQVPDRRAAACSKYAICRRYD